MNELSLKNLPGEVWKPIKGYENLYCVSNKGRVKSLRFNKTLVFSKLKRGYLIVTLTKNKKRKSYLVHRLVANAFLKNPNNLPCINHRDETHNNNCVENLEWCSYSYNNAYGTRKERIKLKAINNPKRSKPVKCLDLETKLVTYYESLHEAGRQLEK